MAVGMPNPTGIGDPDGLACFVKNIGNAKYIRISWDVITRRVWLGRSEAASEIKLLLRSYLLVTQVHHRMAMKRITHGFKSTFADALCHVESANFRTDA